MAGQSIETTTALKLITKQCGKRGKGIAALAEANPSLTRTRITYLLKKAQEQGLLLLEGNRRTAIYKAKA